MSSENEPRPQLGQVVAGAMVASILIYIAVGLLLVQTGSVTPAIEGPAASALAIALLALGIASVAVSFLLRARLGSLPALASPMGRLRLTLILMAIAESPAIFGLVYLLLTGQLPVAVILWGISLGASILHFPRRSGL